MALKAPSLQDLVKNKMLVPASVGAGDIEKAFNEAKSLVASAGKLNGLSGDHAPAMFRLLYEASHNLLSVAIWIKGYEVAAVQGHRQALFAIQPAILPLDGKATELLTDAHNIRNKISYGGTPASSRDFPSLVGDMHGALAEMLREAEFIYKSWLRDLGAAGKPGAA